MLDIGSWEFLIVIVIALMVIGPKDLPALVRNVSAWIRRARGLAREFQSGLEDMARETELDKMTEAFKTDLDPDGLVDAVRRDVEQTIDPDGTLRDAYDPYDMGPTEDSRADGGALAEPDTFVDPEIGAPTAPAEAGEDGAGSARPGG